MFSCNIPVNDHTCADTAPNSLFSFARLQALEFSYFPFTFLGPYCVYMTYNYLILSFLPLHYESSTSAARDLSLLSLQAVTWVAKNSNPCHSLSIGQSEYSQQSVNEIIIYMAIHVLRTCIYLLASLSLKSSRVVSSHLMRAHNFNLKLVQRVQQISFPYC